MSEKDRKNDPMLFTFGEPENVRLDQMRDLSGVSLNHYHGYYQPPVSLRTIARLRLANTHHSSALIFKRNVLSRYYNDTAFLPIRQFMASAYERCLFGQAYFKRVYGRVGASMRRLEMVPGLNMRRMEETNRYCMLQPGDTFIRFKPDEIIHITEYDPNQQIYGFPEYYAAMQSILLNESATLFRRKYYDNGAHMGYVFSVSGADLDQEQIDMLQKAITESKGAGNFKNMFIHLPRGTKDSVQILPVGDVQKKDEFERIKNVTRNDILSMHRIPPALAAVMPENVGGYGDIEKINRVNYENEVMPMQLAMKELNDYIPVKKAITFSQPEK